MSKRLTIDRFEGDIAVCERGLGDFVDIPRAELPASAREGSVLVSRDGGWELDDEDAEARAERIKQKAESLFNR